MGEYEQRGYLPEAMVNFLALLGWSPGSGDREVFSRDELARIFTLEGISGGNAVFNPEKLDWFSQQYLMRMEMPALLARLRPRLEVAGLWRQEFESGPFSRSAPRVSTRASHPYLRTMAERVRAMPSSASSRARASTALPRGRPVKLHGALHHRKNSAAVAHGVYEREPRQALRLGRHDAGNGLVGRRVVRIESRKNNRVIDPGAGRALQLLA